MPGWYTVSESNLPVELPYIEDYRPRGTGVSPLAQDSGFYKVSCPGCGQLLTLSEDAKAGDLVECCGQRYRLTFEYGAFAAEEL